MSTHAKLVGFSSRDVRDTVLTHLNNRDNESCGYSPYDLEKIVETLSVGSWVIWLPCCQRGRYRYGLQAQRLSADGSGGTQSHAVYVYLNASFQASRFQDVLWLSSKKLHFLKGTMTCVEEACAFD